MPLLSVQTIRNVARANGRARRIVLWIVDALLLTALVFQVVVFWGKGQEDAFISFRYAWNLVHGNGLVYNAGERVEGMSNLFWTLSLAAFNVFGLPFPAAAYLMAAVYAAAMFWVLRAVSRTLFGRDALLARLPLLFVAAMTALPASFGNGLEGSAWCFGLTLAAAGILERRMAWLTVSAVVMMLNRPEGIVPTVLASAWAVWAWRNGEVTRRALLVFLSTVGLTFLLLVFFRLAYYGDFVPNSVRAKAAPLSLALIADGGRYVLSYAHRVGWWLWALALAAIVRRGQRRAILTLFALIAFGFALVVRHGGDWMEDFRLLVPYLPMTALLVALGADALGTWKRPAGIAACAVAVLASLWLIEPGELRVLPEFDRDWMRSVLRDPADNAYPFVANTGRANLRNVMQPGEKAVLETGGLLGYLLNGKNVVELNGLTDRDIARNMNAYAYRIPTVGTINWVEVLRKDPEYLLLFYLPHLASIADIPETAQSLRHYVLVQEDSPPDGPKGLYLLVRDDRPALADFVRDYGAFAPAIDHLDPDAPDGVVWTTAWQNEPWRDAAGRFYAARWHTWDAAQRLAAALPLPEGQSDFSKPLAGNAPLIFAIGAGPKTDPHAHIDIYIDINMDQSKRIVSYDLQRGADNGFATWFLRVEHVAAPLPARIRLRFEAKNAGIVSVADFRWTFGSLPAPSEHASAEPKSAPSLTAQTGR